MIAVVQMTAQLANTVQMLVEFWKDIQDAPDEVQTLFEEIGALQPLLKMIKENDLEKRSDPALDTVIQRCNKQLCTLAEKLPNFDPDSVAIGFNFRTWKSSKIVVRKKEIKALLRTIDRTKLTLILLQLRKLDSIQRVHPPWLATPLIVPRRMVELQKFQQPANCSPAFPNQATEVDVHAAKICQNVTPPLAMQQDLEHGLVLRNHYHNTPSARCRATPLDSLQWTGEIHSDSYLQLWQSRFFVQTPMYSISVSTLARKVTTTDSSTKTQSVIKDICFIFYPSRLLSFVGLSSGIWAYGTYTTSWKWTPKIFNAVSKTAPIFEVCRKGELDAIKTLLDNGYASANDMDPTGQTPLLVSSNRVFLFFVSWPAMKIICSGNDLLPHSSLTI